MAHILVVEDEEDDRDAYRAALERAGHEVEAFDHAEAALTYLASHRPDLIITDLLLPGIDGAEFCRDVREDPRTATVPIVMISSMTEHMGIRITPEDARWAPLDRFLEKGVSLQEILEVVEELVGHGAAPPAL